MATTQLNTTATVILQGGTGTTAPVGPTSGGEVWNVTLLSVQCSSALSEAIASVYYNGVLIGTSTWGSTGDSDTSVNIPPMAVGSSLTCTWTGGDDGAVATFSVMGTRQW